jgi:hypothetical protein
VITVAAKGANMLYEVVIRYDRGKVDRFLAKEPPTTPDAVLARRDELTPFAYTAPSGQELVNYVRGNKVDSIVVNEVQEPPSLY